METNNETSRIELESFTPITNFDSQLFIITITTQIVIHSQEIATLLIDIPEEILDKGTLKASWIAGIEGSTIHPSSEMNSPSTSLLWSTSLTTSNKIRLSSYCPRTIDRVNTYRSEIKVAVAI